MLTAQLHAMIAASVSIKSSQKLKKILEIILALGNYMNSSKRGAVYGFKLQSLDLLLETKSTDRTQTLLHYISNVVQEKYPTVAPFYNELHYVDKRPQVTNQSAGRGAQRFKQDSQREKRVLNTQAKKFKQAKKSESGERSIGREGPAERNGADLERVQREPQRHTQDFISRNESRLQKLQEDARIAQ
ncbi:hypothetical protein WMY93_032626, partial [Mugilogobius chulae]